MYWAYTIGLAYLLNRFFEIPVTNLRDKVKIGGDRSVQMSGKTVS